MGRLTVALGTRRGPPGAPDLPLMYPPSLLPPVTERVLEGLPPLTFESGHRFSPLGALTAVAAFQGQEVGYPWLMGLSGGAFRACWSDEWALRMTYAAPEDLVANGARALGLEATSRVDLDLEEAWDRIQVSVDDSRPVLTCGLAGAPEFCIIYGYREEPRTLFVRSYFAGEDQGGVSFGPWVGWNYAGYGRNPLVLLEEGGDDGPSPQEALERALRFARGEGPLADRGRDLHHGLEAYRAWRRALEDVEGDLESRAFTMALNLNALLDARRTASEFLQILAAMNPDWRPGLARAAEHYGHQVTVLGQARGVLYFPLEAPDEAAPRAARDLADPDRREKYGSLLGAALEEEKLSLDWIERVLEGEGP